MRELRTFELDEPGRPVSWRARHGQSVTALEGSLWLTLEGHPADIWLRPGDVYVLAEGERVWLSGETAAAPFARFLLTETPAPWSLRRAVFIAHGRGMALDEPGGQFGPIGGCWVWQPERATHAKRMIGSTHDFAARPEVLTRDDRAWLAFAEAERPA